MKAAARRAALGVALAALTASALACEPHLPGEGVARIEGKRYVLAWRALPAIQVGEFFRLQIATCSREGQPTVRTLRVDAQMPEHKHGMDYRATVRPQGPGRFVVEGMLLHMPGRWEFSFDLNVGVDRETLRTDVTID
jgi:hypothetical protein